VLDDLLAVLPLHGVRPGHDDIDPTRLLDAVSARAGAELSRSDLQAAEQLLEHVLTGTPADDPSLWDAIASHAPAAAARARLHAAYLRLRGQMQHAHRLDVAAGSLDAAGARIAREDRSALLGETRSFVTLAFADELAADPALLDAYAAVFGPEDDASLVIFGPDRSSDDVGAALGPVVDVLGLDDERCPDLLAVGQPAALEQSIAAHVCALYTRRPPAGAFAGLPAFDDATIADLVELAA
jgi:hypothetical protein